MKRFYSYRDIVLLPDYSTIVTRSNVNCNPNFLGKTFKSIAIPANMKCTVSFDKAYELASNNCFYVLHRFYDYNDILNWVKSNQDIYLSISVGVKGLDYDLVKDALRKHRVDCITIDVAHGHHLSVKKMIQTIKALNSSVKVIAGNIGTKKALNDLKSWGADAVKVGLSMGKSCTTYNCTGVGTPMFSAVYNMTHDNEGNYVNPGIDIIADGQIREVGDVCKALVAGANMVMIGSEFAKCSDSPADTLDNMKIFFGSASSYNKNSDKYIEGQKVLLQQRTENYQGFIKRINEGIQSCMSYAGVENINDLVNMEFGVTTGQY
jgi:GMP reductase